MLSPQILTLLDSFYDGVYMTDSNRTITFWSKGAERITGFSAQDVVGRACYENILNHVDEKGMQLCVGHCPLAGSLIDKNPREAEVYLHHKDGHRVPVWVRTSVITDEAGDPVAGVELFTDLSDRRDSLLRVKELESLALLDPLTRLGNRALLERELASRFDEYDRYDIPFGILFLDIDHFKAVNDTYGHQTGDEILKLVAHTLSSNARSFDTFGRWGGEEFIGIIRNVDRAALVEIAERMRLLIAEGFIYSGTKRVSVTVSIGAAMIEEGDSAESLTDRADRRMYASKLSGRDRVTSED